MANLTFISAQRDAQKDVQKDAQKSQDDTQDLLDAASAAGILKDTKE